MRDPKRTSSMQQVIDAIASDLSPLAAEIIYAAYDKETGDRTEKAAVVNAKRQREEPEYYRMVEGLFKLGAIELIKDVQHWEMQYYLTKDGLERARQASKFSDPNLQADLIIKARPARALDI